MLHSFCFSALNRTRRLLCKRGVRICSRAGIYCVMRRYNFHCVKPIQLDFGISRIANSPQEYLFLLSAGENSARAKHEGVRNIAARFRCAKQRINLNDIISLPQNSPPFNTIAVISNLNFPLLLALIIRKHNDFSDGRDLKKIKKRTIYSSS